MDGPNSTGDWDAVVCMIGIPGGNLERNGWWYGKRNRSIKGQRKRYIY